MFSEEQLRNAVAKDIAIRKATEEQGKEKLKRIEEVIDDNFVDDKRQIEAEFLAIETIQEHKRLKGY